MFILDSMKLVERGRRMFKSTVCSLYYIIIHDCDNESLMTPVLEEFVDVHSDSSCPDDCDECAFLIERKDKVESLDRLQNASSYLWTGLD